MEAALKESSNRPKAMLPDMVVEGLALWVCEWHTEGDREV
jgi:hypothetical protein